MVAFRLCSVAMARWACRLGVICAVGWWGGAAGAVSAVGFCGCGCDGWAAVLLGFPRGESGSLFLPSVVWEVGRVAVDVVWGGRVAGSMLGSLGWGGVGVVSLSRMGGTDGDCGWDGVGVRSLNGSEWVWGVVAAGDSSSKSMLSSSDSRGAKRLVVFFWLRRRFCTARGILGVLGGWRGCRTGSVKVFVVSGYQLFPWLCDRHFDLVGMVGGGVFICVRLF